MLYVTWYLLFVLFLLLYDFFFLVFRFFFFSRPWLVESKNVEPMDMESQWYSCSAKMVLFFGMAASLMHLGVIFFMFILPVIHWTPWVCGFTASSSLENVAQYFLKYFFSTSHQPHQNSNYSDIRSLDVIPWLTFSLHVVFWGSFYCYAFKFTKQFCKFYCH